MTEQPYTQREKCELIERYQLHCSVAQLDALIAEIEKRALQAQNKEKNCD